MALEGGTVVRSRFGSRQIERVFFIVDRSKLKQETDELRNAIVVYIPEGDMKKPNLEQRCSQLVGISLCILHFTNKLPKYIRLKSHGYAIRSLGDSTYIMGLQSKFEEPQWSVVQYLEMIHDFFLFYYLSPYQVMKTSVDDWEIFTVQMTKIFQCILDFTFRDTHSLPSMFNPLPYVSMDRERGGTGLFLQAHRLLRNVQLNENIIAGCMFYGGKLLCSQLPPEISEKLLLVANDGVELNSKSILGDMQTPDKVWVVDVFLTPEELAILHHITQPRLRMSLLYPTLTPNTDLTSAIFCHDKTVQMKLEDVSRQNRRISDFGNSNEWSTVIYGSNCSLERSGISPLKRPRRNRGNSYERVKGTLPDYESLFLSSEEVPPPLPPRPQPPPIPERKKPTPPPRSTSIKEPETTLKLALNVEKEDKNDVDLSSKQWMYGNVLEIPPSVVEYTTPTSSLPPEDIIVSRHDSDTSEGFGTPPSSSPVPDHCMSDTVGNSQVFGTPLVEDSINMSIGIEDIMADPLDANSGIDIYHDSLSSPVETSAVLNLGDDSKTSVSTSTKEDEALTRKISQQSNLSELSCGSSLIITKAISEPASSRTNSLVRNIDGLTLSDTDIGQPECKSNESLAESPLKLYISEPRIIPAQPVAANLDVEDQDFDFVEDTVSVHSPQNRSPPHEFNDSTSEAEDVLATGTDYLSMKRPRAETWVGMQTSDEDEFSEIRRASPLERRTLYIQKCVNTVIAILADTSLPEDHKGIQSLWTMMLTQLLDINNKVESCLLEKEALYEHVSGENPKTDVRNYQAVYSGITGNCEVSSITAAYQFRHAARRAHQEFIVNPSLRQISLCKDYCRMFCQNVMGRESYLHSNKVIIADTLSIHGALEKQAKAMRKSTGQNNADNVDDTPNVSFL